jgi:hypothetical protein
VYWFVNWRMPRIGAILLIATMSLVSCGGGGDSPPVAENGSVRTIAAVETTGSPLRAPQSSISAAVAVDPSVLFDWAETNYPQYFPSQRTAQTSGPYVYRYYPETNTYLAVTNGVDVQVLGPQFGPDIVTVGTVAHYACVVSPQACIQLFRLPDSFFGGSDVLLSLPFSGAASVNANSTCIGSGCPTDYEVTDFKLVASGRAYTIASLSAINLTPGSNVAPIFDGLSEGRVINAGETLLFKLRSGFTRNATVNLLYSFKIQETGQTFSYNVQLRTN